MFKSGGKILSYGHLKFKNALGEVMVLIQCFFVSSLHMSLAIKPSLLIFNMSNIYKKQYF